MVSSGPLTEEGHLAIIDGVRRAVSGQGVVFDMGGRPVSLVGRIQYCRDLTCGYIGRIILCGYMAIHVDVFGRLQRHFKVHQYGSQLGSHQITFLYLVITT